MNLVQYCAEISKRSVTHKALRCFHLAPRRRAKRGVDEIVRLCHFSCDSLNQRVLQLSEWLLALYFLLAHMH
jgi:hypothetical protein